MKERYNIEGMNCAACSAAVTRAVSRLDGIKNVTVSLMTNSMDVDYDEKSVSPEAIISAVEKAGYSASYQKSAEKQVSSDEKTDIFLNQLIDMKLRLKVSIPFTIILMYVAMAHMWGLPFPDYLVSTQGAVSFALLQFLLALPVVITNFAYYRNGFKALFNLNPNMDSLIAIGSSAALLYGVYALFVMSYSLGMNLTEITDKYRTNLYFESAATILTLVTVGKYFETKSKRQTSKAITHLMDLTPKMSRLVADDGSETMISADDLKVGDIVKVIPGESIPADGTIISGFTSIDESAVTGESLPAEKKSGDKVIGATINKTGTINFRVNKTGKDTTISKIIQLVTDANATKAPIESLADKVAGVFVPAVIAISLVTLAVWLFAGKEFAFAAELAVSVLVISCPCALGLATPVAVMVATGKGADNGILFKDSESLEKLHETNVAIFDKTGTLSEGSPAVTDIVIDKNLDKHIFLNALYALEKNSEQPLAQAVINYAKPYARTAKEIGNFSAIPGKGVAGTYDGIDVYCGNEKLMEEKNIDISSLKPCAEKLQQNAKTSMYFAMMDKCAGLIAVSDRLKNTSKEAVSRLKTMGIKTVMLSGDNALTANAVSNALGIDVCHADVLPDGKDACVKEYQANGARVVMVGDGINDAPSLARADVGIAIGAGTDIAIESADVVLIKSDPQDVVTGIALSKKTLKIIKQNLFWAFFYNAICIPLAAGAFYPAFGTTLNPMIASLAMSFSSVFVVSNSLRLRNFKSNKTLHYKKSDNNQANDVKIEYVKIKTAQNNLYKNEIANKNKEENFMEKVISIDGMMCAHCVSHVTKALEDIGVKNPEVSLEKNQALVNTSISNEKLKAAIEDAGYTVTKIA